MAKFQITRGIYISHDLEKERKIIMTCSAVDRSYMYLSKVFLKIHFSSLRASSGLKEISHDKKSLLNGDNRYKFKGAN